MTDAELAPRPLFSVDGGHSLHAWLRSARDNRPVYFDENVQAWRVIRYDDAVRLLADWKTYSNDLPRLIPTKDLVEGNFGMMDPPEHRHYRNYVGGYFTPRALTHLQDRIAKRVNAAFDAADIDGMNIVDDLAYPLPLDVINDLFNVPDSDRDFGVFRRYSDAQMPLSSTENFMDESVLRAREESNQELLDYLRALTRGRRAAPQDDLISHLTSAQVDGRPLAEEELLTILVVLLSGGHITSMGLLGSLFVCLAETPSMLDTLRENPSLVPGAVEEVLRFRPSLPDVARVTNREVTIAGQTLAPDQLIMISLLSANRDERQFADPNRFDCGRTPNPHLAFSYGTHFCIGAHLARMEAQTILKIVLERFRRVHQTHVQWPPIDGLAAPIKLTVAFEK
jgi:cytochrome P450